MTARDRMTPPDRSPTPNRFPAADLPTEIIPAATGSAAPTAALGGPENSDDEDGKFGLSITQILASTAAAVTAALIGSRLGVAGTLVGAALASIVSGVGAAIYSHSLLVTRRQMKKALQLVRPHDQTKVATAAVAGGEHAATRRARALVAGDDLTVLMPAMIPPTMPPRRARGRGRSLTAALAGVAAAGVIFAGALATVTLVETVKGAPLSGGDSGLSVLGGNGSSGTSTDPSTATVTTPAASSLPPSTIVTQTVTQSPTVSSQPARQSTAPTTAPTSGGPASGNTPANADQSESAAGSAAGQAPTTAAPTS